MSKRFWLAALAAVVCFCAAGCGTTGAASASPQAEESPANDGAPQNGTTQVENSADGNVSYSFGLILGSDLKQTGLTFDYSEFIEGFRDSLENREARLSPEGAMSVIQTKMQEAMAAKAAENKRLEDEFLAENGAKAGVQITPSGLQYEVITQGTGEKPGPADMVEVHYEGRLLDGTQFDSSYDRNEPAVFPLDQVIPGWSEGIQLMNVGGSYTLYIPSALAYGDQGAGSTIPPNSTLIFNVELLSIKE